MKILFYSIEQPKLSGMSVVLYEVMDILSKDNEFRVLFRSKFADRLNEDKYNVRKTSFTGIKIVDRLLSLKSLYVILRKFMPDIVIVLDVYSCRQVLLCERLLKHKIPVYSWIHNYMDLEFKENKTKKYLRRCDGHLCISSGIYQKLKIFGCVNLNLIFNPLIQRSIHNIGRDNSSRNIIYVGRILLEGQKNLKMLIDSLSICKIKYMLHIIGSGDDEDALMEYAKGLNIHDQILIHGYKIDPWLYIKNEIKTVNALVLPSKREGFGLVLVEALSNGLPCIATSCLSGPSDIIIDGKNGYLVPTDSIHDFARKLELLLNAKFDCSVGLNRFSHESYYYSFMNAISKVLR